MRGMGNTALLAMLLEHTLGAAPLPRKMNASVTARPGMDFESLAGDR